MAEDIKGLAEEVAKLRKELTNTKRELTNTKKLTEEQSARLTQEIESMGDRSYDIVGGQIQGLNIKIMTPDEYREYSEENGLIMGRRPEQKTVCSIEELRALINSNWTPKMVMEKHGLTADDLKQLVWKLSKKELRDKPIKYSIEGNYFSREG
jgi:hypothetical protein